MTASGQERGGQCHTTALVRVAPRKRPYATCLDMSAWCHKRTFALQQISYSMISSVRGLRTCPWARLVMRVSGVRLHSPVGGARGDQQEAGTGAQRHGRGRQTACLMRVTTSSL